MSHQYSLRDVTSGHERSGDTCSKINAMSNHEGRALSMFDKLDRMQEELRAARKSLDSTQFDFNEQLLTMMLSGTLSRSLIGVDFEATQCSRATNEPSQIDQCLSNESSPSKQDTQENNCSNFEPLTSDTHISLEHSTGFKTPDDVPNIESQILDQPEHKPLITSPEPHVSSQESNIIKEEAFSRVDVMDSRSWSKDSPHDQSLKANNVSPVFSPYSSRRVSSTQLEILEELRSAVETAIEEWNEVLTNSSNSNPVHTSKLSNWNEFRKLLELLKERRFDTEDHFEALTEVIDALLQEVNDENLNFNDESPQRLQNLKNLATQLDEIRSKLTEESSNNQRPCDGVKKSVLYPIIQIPRRTQSLSSLDSVLSDLTQYLAASKTPKERWISAVHKIKQIRLLGSSHWRTPYASNAFWNQSQTKIGVRSNLEIFLYGMQPKYR